MMRLDNLKELYFQMQKEGVERCRFPYHNGKGKFDVFFLADERPLILGFGVKVKNVYFEVIVDYPSFKINTFLDKNYPKLLKALEIDSNSRGPHFSSNKFFAHFAKEIPLSLNNINKVLPQDRAVYLQREIEEPDKIFFKGWRENDLWGQKVSEKNLKKTRALLGYEAYKRAKTNNLSSCWTDNEKAANKDFL